MTISSIGTGGTYTTIQSWEDACPADITAAGTNEDWIGECKNQNFSLSSVINIGGSTTDTTHKYILRCESGASFKDHADKATNPLRYDISYGASISNSSTNTLLQTTGENVQIQDLQINGGNIRTVYSEFKNLTVKNCILVGEATVTMSYRNGQRIFENCLIISSTKAWVVHTDFINCTFIGTASVPTYECEYGKTGTVTNCLFLGYSKVSNGAESNTFTNCTTSSSTFSSTQSLISCNVSATSSNEIEAFSTTPSSVDARLKSGAVSKDAGTSAGAPSTDIVGQTRS